MTYARLQNQLGTPETQHNVRSAQEYMEWALIASVNTYGVKPVLDARSKPTLRYGGDLPAHVNTGRWIVTCPCGNHPSAHPEWNLACCVECGTYYKLNMPKNWKKAEALLLQRPIPNRRWYPHKASAAEHGLKKAETLATLQRENKEHADELLSVAATADEPQE